MIARCLLAAVLISATAAQADCLKATAGHQTAEGRVGGYYLIDYAGERRQARALATDSPSCLVGDGPDDRIAPARFIFIFAVDPLLETRISQLQSQMVRVRGEPFAAEAGGKRLIAMRIEAIEPR